ncbi:4Fe-4S dicluster domain-containing protein [Nocardioides sp. MAH-18]|uniref:Glycolate oxidase iron-sulfur subunit n=1 Tax=Nocardioides agri TaxID=2682843 RepID=A0A6L6XV37_9ACTN|nr:MULTISPECIES: heterodisulfide reductase-related iron-sulfur binding cluster [unclassified Nocardioides]MBA2955687.1 4Fe-4S dicluster domain-containing protein [Nocardioides sp. CGMCC 1.13656]MVQ50537.1 4Fe-4S dicluster domain-containing protein [Nocardioides sp. MAH-18]
MGPDPELVDDCVHCGFCLPTCPTYVLWGEEMDSPRGRIHLMQQHVEGAPLTDAMVGHWDACLGCMACVTACPSGVRYDRLIQQTRAEVEAEHERPRSERALRRLIFSVFPYPRRLRVLAGPLRLAQRTGLDRAVRRTGLLDRVAPSLAAMERLAPRLTKPEPLPARAPAAGVRRATVGLLTGCVQGAFFPGVNAATVRVLQAEGCDVVIPPEQGCCGALSAHSGREAEAQGFARAVVDAFASAEVDYVVVNAAGCGSVMKEYAELLGPEAQAFQDKVRDIAELLDELGPVATRHPLEMSVAYHDACHLGHAQGVRVQPRRLLTAIPGLELREIAESELCCGSAGIYNLLNPEPARELGDRKAANIVATGADVLVTANPGCLMQVAAAIEGADHPMRLAHTVEVLDASIRGYRLD